MNKVDPNNGYTQGAIAFYDEAKAAQTAETNHRHHDENPDYDRQFLARVRRAKKKYTGALALDVGCGAGRNIDNLLKLEKFERVDGVDISEPMLVQCRRLLMEEGHKENDDFQLHLSNGVDMDNLPSNEYKYVMSTLTFQHIPVRAIRNSLFAGIYKSMKRGGDFVLQIGFGPGYGKSDYFADDYDVRAYNTKHDVAVTNTEDLVRDLEELGFKNISWTKAPAFSDGHPEWLFVRCKK